MALHDLQSHLACQFIKMCVLIRHTICESLVKFCYQTKMPYFFCDFLMDSVSSHNRKSTENKKLATLGKPRIINGIFGRDTATYNRKQDRNNPKLPTNRYFGPFRV